MDATSSLRHCHCKPFRCLCSCHLQSFSRLTTVVRLSSSKMTHFGPTNVILLLLITLHLSHNASANCTANCIEAHREWPQFDFDFYYEHSGDGPLLETSLVSYSVQSTALPRQSNSQSVYLSPSLGISDSPVTTGSPLIPTITSSLTFSTSEPISHVSLQSITIQPTQSLPSASSSSATNCPCDAKQTRGVTNSTATQTSTSKDLLEHYLLRSVFRNDNNHTDVFRNLTVHFKKTLQPIYEFAIKKQKEQFSSHRMQRHLMAAGNSLINLTIWDLQVDNSSQTIDVIYYLEKDGVFLPYEDALKVMSFASPDFIFNQTGYEVIHKVRRYNDDSVAPRSATLNWLNLNLLIALLMVTILCILLIGMLYLKYRQEKRRGLESINRELNRVMPSHSRTEKDQSHWNYGQDEEEEEDEEPNEDNDGNAYGAHPTQPSTSADKMDKSSQYDFAAFANYRQTPYPDPNVSGLPGSFPRERLIPIGTSSINDSDYDRISYVRTQETLKETKRQPNILEIQLSKETQSIVQEIRKELNRYNFKKIIAQESADQTTSEA